MSSLSMMRGGRVIHDVLDDMIPVMIVVTTNGSAEDIKTVFTDFSANTYSVKVILHI